MVFLEPMAQKLNDQALKTLAQMELGQMVTMLSVVAAEKQALMMEERGLMLTVARWSVVVPVEQKLMTLA